VRWKGKKGKKKGGGGIRRGGKEKKKNIKRRERILRKSVDPFGLEGREEGGGKSLRKRERESTKRGQIVNRKKKREKTGSFQEKGKKKGKPTPFPRSSQTSKLMIQRKEEKGRRKGEMLKKKEEKGGRVRADCTHNLLS